jgi:hypothetical protein
MAERQLRQSKPLSNGTSFIVVVVPHLGRAARGISRPREAQTSLQQAGSVVAPISQRALTRADVSQDISVASAGVEKRPAARTVSGESMATREKTRARLAKMTPDTRVGDPSRLESVTVGAPTLLDYLKRLPVFFAFCALHVIARLSNADVNLAQLVIFVHLFLEKKPWEAGTKLLAAVGHHWPRLHRSGNSGLRPEAHPQMEQQFRCVSILLAPFSRGIPTRINEFNDSVVFNSQGLDWIGHLLASAASHCKVDGMVFNFTMGQWNAVMRKAARLLFISHWEVVPPLLRHSGPSEDYLSGTRSLLEIQLQSRWGGVHSVQRYEKSARESSGMDLLTKQQLSFMNQAVDSIKQVLTTTSGALDPNTLCPSRLEHQQVVSHDD